MGTLTKARLAARSLKNGRAGKKTRLSQTVQLYLAGKASQKHGARQKPDSLALLPEVVQKPILSTNPPPPRPRRRTIRAPAIASRLAYPVQPVHLKRIPSQPRVVTVPRRRKRKRARSLFAFNASSYGTINELRVLLDLPALDQADENPQAKAKLRGQETVFIALDTENERHGLMNHVVEVGISILKTRDLREREPGKFARDWISKVKTHHYVVDITRSPSKRMYSGLFSSSEFLNGSALKDELRQLFSDVVALSPDSDSKQDGGTPPRLVLVGQSVAGDLAALLNDSNLRIDLGHDGGVSDMGVRFDHTFDTYALADQAKFAGAHMPGKKLGQLAYWLGVDEKYKRPASYREPAGSVVGTHNAGNDATYTMMVLLLFAVRWPVITCPRRAVSSVIGPQAEPLSQPWEVTTSEHKRPKMGSWLHWLRQWVGKIFTGS